jgi:hypothetical protein
MSDTFSKVEVITGVARRRRFSTELETGRRRRDDAAPRVDQLCCSLPQAVAEPGVPLEAGDFDQPDAHMGRRERAAALQRRSHPSWTKARNRCLSGDCGRDIHYGANPVSADRAALARLNRTVCEPDAIACDMRRRHHPSSTASIVVRPLCALVARFEGRVGMWRGGGRPGMSEPSVPHKDDRSTPLPYPKPR